MILKKGIKCYSSGRNREIFSGFLSFFLRETILKYEKLTSSVPLIFNADKDFGAKKMDKSKKKSICPLPLPEVDFFRTILLVI